MTQVYRIVAQLSWVLGLLSILATIVVRCFHLSHKVQFQPHTFLFAASAFFLCALASRAMERP